MTQLDELKRLAELSLHELGCGDGSCYFKKPEGMHTNGGCRCLENINKGSPYKRIYFRAANPTAILSIIASHEQLQSKFNEAVEVIKFYSNGGNLNRDIWFDEKLGYFTGKRAREFLRSLDKGE